MKTFLNVLGCIFASLLSIVLVITLLIFPAYRAIASLATTSTIKNIVQNIDYAKLLPSSEELKKTLGENWEEIPLIGEMLKTDSFNQVVDDIIKSKAMGKVVELYAGDLINALMQKEEEKQLTTDAFKDIVIKESKSLVQILRPYIPESTTLTDEELAAEIQTYVSQNADQILGYLPDIAELTGVDGSTDDIINGVENGDIDVDEVIDKLENGTYTYRPEEAHAQAGSEQPSANDPLATLRQLLAPSVSITFAVIIAALVLLIALCRFNRFGGMLWLGIDAVIAALPVALIAIGVKSIPLATLLGDDLNSLSPILSSIISTLSGKLVLAAAIYAVVGIALIVGYVLLGKSVKSKAVPAEKTTEETITTQE